MGNRIAIACDHRGVSLKNKIITFLQTKKYDVTDFGTNTAEIVDYPDYAEKVANSLQKNDADFGILICGSGVGMSVAANKFAGVRAGVACNAWQAEHGRKFDHTNVLVLASEMIKDNEEEKIVEAFLNTNLEGGRYERRIKKIEIIEKRKH